MQCKFANSLACRQLQNFYIKNHFNRYIKTLRDKDYMSTMNMTSEEVQCEIRALWTYKQNLEQFDEIKYGLRKKKEIHLFHIRKYNFDRPLFQ